MSWAAVGAGALAAGASYFGNKKAGEAEERGFDEAAAFQNRALDAQLALSRPQLEVGNSALGVLASLFGLQPPSQIDFNQLGSSGAGRSGVFTPGSSLSGEQQRVLNSFSESFGFDPTLEINRHRILGLDQTTLPSNRLKEDLAAFQSAFGFDPSRQEGNPFYDTSVVAQQQQQQAAPALNLDELVNNNPLIRFQREQGEQQIQRAASARGVNQSGGTLKDLTRFNTDLTGAGVQQFVLNPLFELAGFGSRAGQQAGSAVANTGNNLANIAVGAGNSRSSAFQNNGAIASNAIGRGFDIWGNRGFGTINNGPDLSTLAGLQPNGFRGI